MKATRWTEGRVRFFLLILIGLGSALRGFVCWQHNPLDYLFSDPLRHWVNGEQLFAPNLMGASDPILYQAYIGIIRGLTHDGRFAVALICGLLSVVMPWTFYRAGRELGLARPPALIAWALIAWTPSLFTIYHYVMMETLLLPLVGLALWMTARAQRRDEGGAWLIAVVCWVLALLTKVTVLPLAALCLGWVWWRNSHRGWRLLAAILLTAALLVPNAVRTRQYLGFVAPFGNGWLTKIQHRSGAREIKLHYRDEDWGFASPSVTVQPLAPLSGWAIRRAWEPTEVQVVVDPAHGEADWKAADQRLDVSWAERGKQLVENVLLFLFAPSWPDGNRDEWDGWLAYWSRWMWAPLIFVVLECNLRDFLRRRFDLLPVAASAFTLFLMFQNIATAEGRYRKPLEPLILLNLVWAFRSPPTSRAAR